MTNKQTIMLCILDGWGIEPEGAVSTNPLNNAIVDAKPEFYNYLLANYPNSQLATSGEDVGLPHGQMGNSEVGHMTIGCGRIIDQDLPKITKAIATGAIEKNPVLTELIQTLQLNGKTCHLAGLVSDGGVHSHVDHIIFLAKFIASHKVRVQLHIVTDGRDSSPQSGKAFCQRLVDLATESEFVSIATISGRYYAMDRDKRFERTKLYYDTVMGQSNIAAENFIDLIATNYNNGITDEFIKPTSAIEYVGIQNGDAFVMANFRADRVRQLMTALGASDFTEFTRDKIVKFSALVGMTEYSADIGVFTKAIFPAQIIANTMAEILSKHNLRQLRITETEKYAHVTFFFNAGIEAPLVGEDRILINSPQVATYDLKPEMSSKELTDSIIANITSQKYDFILVNFPNTDMVGHTGNYHATIEAVRAVDFCLKKIYAALSAIDGILIVTADHGNAEKMYDEENNTIFTSHTTYPVPFIIVSNNSKNIKLQNGNLADIAPTILALFKLEIPKEMTGKNLIHSKII